MFSSSYVCSTMLCHIVNTFVSQYRMHIITKKQNIVSCIVFNFCCVCPWSSITLRRMTRIEGENLKIYMFPSSLYNFKYLCCLFFFNMFLIFRILPEITEEFLYLYGPISSASEVRNHLQFSN